MGLFEPSRRGDRFGVRDARGRLVLDADAAARLNAIRAELRRLDRFAASPPLAYSSDAAGRRWQLGRPVSVYAKLTGTSGSAYTWAEATRDASGVSSLLSGGRTGTAYEANLATGLTGKYATIDWTPASSDWRFQAIRSGTGGGTSGTAGYTACCPSDAIPATLSLTFTFGGGLNAASYSNQTQNCTLTYSATAPSYAGGGAHPGHYSPLFTDSFGFQDYYFVSCTFSGFLALAFGSDGFSPACCCTVPLVSCSPLLASGGPSGSGCSGTASCFIHNPTGGGSSTAFGDQPGDNITIS